MQVATATPLAETPLHFDGQGEREGKIERWIEIEFDRDERSGGLSNIASAARNIEKHTLL